MEYQLIAIILSVVLVGITVYFTIFPLLSGEIPFQHKKEEKIDMSTLKESLFTTLNEVELDYEMGKVSDEDYQGLKRKYEREIAELMKEDEIKSSSNLDKDIMKQVEEEIQAALSKKVKKGAK